MHRLITLLCLALVGCDGSPLPYYDGYRETAPPDDGPAVDLAPACPPLTETVGGACTVAFECQIRKSGSSCIGGACCFPRPEWYRDAGP